MRFSHIWLNVELEVQSNLGSMSRDVHSCSHWLRPRKPPPPRIWALMRDAQIDDISLKPPGFSSRIHEHFL